MLKLFSRRRNAAPELPQKEVLAVLDPEPVGAIPEGYGELAERAGFAGYSAVVAQEDLESQRRRFRGFLAENGVGVYDVAKVRAYLKSQQPKLDLIWQRVEKPGMVDDDHWRRREEIFVWTNAGGQMPQAERVYEKPIPEPVLMTMAKIREAYPSAEFFVSDFASLPKGDPFLMVYAFNEALVIERWDEPGFRM